MITRRHLLEQTVGAAALATAPGRARAPGAGAAPRLREPFDFEWKFFKGDAPGAEQPAFSDAAWRALDLPHDWSVEGPFAQNEKASGAGGYLPTGIGWYRKLFRLPGSYRDRQVGVEFDGVYQNSEVWINGRYLGRRPFGYIGFAYDLTPHLNPTGENVLAVKVDNSAQPGSRWYSGSGIYRHTWLAATHPFHIALWGAFVTTPRVTRDAAAIQVKTRLRNRLPVAASGALSSTVLDREGQAAASVEAVEEIAPHGEYEFVQTLRLDTPNLWSVEQPYLYTLRSRVRAVGAAVPERVWERRFEILKEMGSNAIRTAHNPVAPEFLDLCDRMGFLVMNEAFDEWRVPKGQIGPYGYSQYFDQWHERDVTDLVRRDRNHPSVVLWSAGNEIGDQVNPRGVETLRQLLAIFHREDPTRPVTAGCDQISAEPRSVSQDFLSLLDVVGYNYVDRWRDRREKYFSIDRAAYPNRKVIGTESSGMGGIRGDYRFLVPAAPAPAPGRRFGRPGFRGLDTEQLWRFVRTYDYVAGDFMWTGIDHLGEAFWPGKGSSSGVLDICGFKKDGFYFYQSQWTAAPMLHLFPHWNWKGLEGRFLPVYCFTNCDSVELFLNGRSVGVKGYAFPRPGMEQRYGTYPPRASAIRTTNDLHLSWDVPYEPGTLKAVGTKDGKVVLEREVVTTGAPAAIVLAADRATIRADRRDLAHIMVQVTDSAGRLVPDADHEIAFRVEGDGRLIGLDNGDPASHEDYRSGRRKAFNGLCLAMVQSTVRAGEVRLSAASPGLEPAAVNITTR